MDDRQEPIHVVREEGQDQRSHTGAWLAAVIVILVIALAVTVGYVYRAQDNAKALATRDSDMNATISQMQNQIDALTAKLNQPPAATPTPVTPTQPSESVAAARRQSAMTNKRFKAVEDAIVDQNKEMKATQDQVAQTRSDFEAGLSSTREDLNGSIARTHDELVALEQRGERSYFEFDITKAKHFQKEGPLMVSLRKADPKHERYDLAMVVNDNQLSKKNINLYEPVWVSGADREQVQLVVNKIDRDHIHGYVSAPKYSQASFTNVSARSGNSGANENPAPNSNAAPATNDNSTVNDSSSTPNTPQQPQAQPQQ
jgi:hypothetical protein